MTTTEENARHTMCIAAFMEKRESNRSSDPDSKMSLREHGSAKKEGENDETLERAEEALIETEIGSSYVTSN